MSNKIAKKDRIRCFWDGAFSVVDPIKYPIAGEMEFVDSAEELIGNSWMIVGGCIRKASLKQLERMNSDEKAKVLESVK